jgi:hypothetical protein
LEEDEEPRAQTESEFAAFANDAEWTNRRRRLHLEIPRNSQLLLAEVSRLSPPYQLSNMSLGFLTAVAPARAIEYPPFTIQRMATDAALENDRSPVNVIVIAQSRALRFHNGSDAQVETVIAFFTR